MRFIFSLFAVLLTLTSYSYASNEFILDFENGFTDSTGYTSSAYNGTPTTTTLDDGNKVFSAASALTSFYTQEINFNNNPTIEFWIKKSNISSNYTNFFEHGDFYIFFPYSTNYPIRVSPNLQSFTLDTTEWKHIKISFDNDTIYIYADGNLLTTQSKTSLPSNNFEMLLKSTRHYVDNFRVTYNTTDFSSTYTIPPFNYSNPPVYNRTINNKEYYYDSFQYSYSNAVENSSYTFKIKRENVLVKSFTVSNFNQTEGTFIFDFNNSLGNYTELTGSYDFEFYDNTSNASDLLDSYSATITQPNSSYVYEYYGLEDGEESFNPKFVLSNSENVQFELNKYLSNYTFVQTITPATNKQHIIPTQFLNNGINYLYLTDSQGERLIAFYYIGSTSTIPIPPTIEIPQFDLLSPGTWIPSLVQFIEDIYNQYKDAFKIFESIFAIFPPQWITLTSFLLSIIILLRILGR